MQIFWGQRIGQMAVLQTELSSIAKHRWTHLQIDILYVYRCQVFPINGDNAKAFAHCKHLHMNTGRHIGWSCNIRCTGVWGWQVKQGHLHGNKFSHNRPLVLLLSLPQLRWAFWKLTQEETLELGKEPSICSLDSDGCINAIVLYKKWWHRYIIDCLSQADHLMFAWARIVCIQVLKWIPTMVQGKPHYSEMECCAGPW